MSLEKKKTDLINVLYFLSKLRAEKPGPIVLQLSPTSDRDVTSSQTYCWGFCGTEAAVARLLAASLAFPEASFTESLSSRWCVSPACTDKDTRET